MRRCAVADGYLMDELSVEDGSAIEHPASAKVIFDELLQGSAGTLKYEARWIDPDSGKVYPGTLLLTLPLSDQFKPFVLTHPYAERPLVLALSISAEANGQRAVRHIGPYDDGEYVWDSSVATELPASVEWLTPDSDPEQAEAQTQTPAPPWQEDAIRNLTSKLEASVATSAEIKREIRALRYVAIAIGVWLIVYAVAKAI